jgi:hypothetical protein
MRIWSINRFNNLMLIEIFVYLAASWKDRGLSMI